MATRKQSNTMWNRAQPLYKEFIQAGVEPMAALGVLGNIAAESSFNPHAVGSTGTYTGYTQNSPDISGHIKRYYGGYGHKEQMQFMIDGLHGRIRGNNTPVGRMLQNRFNQYNRDVKRATTPAQAATMFERSYEKSGGQILARRQKFANDFYRQLGGSVDDYPDYTELYQRTPSATPYQMFNPTIDPPEIIALDVDQNQRNSNSTMPTLSALVQTPLNPQYEPEPQEEFSYFNNPYDNSFHLTLGI